MFTPGLSNIPCIARIIELALDYGSARVTRTFYLGFQQVIVTLDLGVPVGWGQSGDPVSSIELRLMHDTRAPLNAGWHIWQLWPS